MKICLITALYKPYIIGGAEVYVERIANELAKDNEVVVITTKPYSGLKSLKPSVEVQKGVKIYRFYPLNVYYGYYAKKRHSTIRLLFNLVDIWNPHTYFIMKEILKKEEPDVVHTHILWMLSTSALSAIRSLNIPHIHTIHEYLLLNRWSNLLRRGEKLIEKFNIFDKMYMKVMKKLSSSIDIVLAPSEFAFKIHVKNGYFINSRYAKLSLGIDIMNSHKVEKDYKVIDILYVGQLTKYKGVQVLINAFKQIYYENIRLHIVGKGFYAEEFKKISGYDPRIKFYGYISDEELMKSYQKANITVVPSIYYDNSPTVIYESMMNGTPVIGSRIGGIPELIEEGYNGFLFEAGDVDELKEILENLIKNPSELRRLEEGASESVKKYDMVEHIRKLKKLYREVQR